MPDFFDKKDDTQTESQSIKIGEKEYTQEELSKIVGLGETAQEYETKWNRPIKEFYPDYTQKSQRLADLERKEAERQQVAEEMKKKEDEERQKEVDERAAKGQLTPEEQKQFALKQARELGILTREEFETEVSKRVSDVLAGKELLQDIDATISEADEKGKPKTTAKDLLTYMDENGIKNPGKAYKLMFEEELDKWKEDQIKGIKPAGMTTQTGSTAGAKQPPAPKILSRDDLGQAIRDSLTRSRGV